METDEQRQARLKKEARERDAKQRAARRKADGITVMTPEEVDEEFGDLGGEGSEG